ncbi:hypothetical protein BDV10DRAFT_187578 [Aspergillus recurvatus]
MAPLEEGVLKQWRENRIVLVTISPGLGQNPTIAGIAHFTSALVPLLKEHPMPSFKQLAGVFEEYRTRQKPQADAVVSSSIRSSLDKRQGQGRSISKVLQR